MKKEYIKNKFSISKINFKMIENILFVKRTGPHAHLSKSTARRIGLPEFPPNIRQLDIDNEYVTPYRMGFCDNYSNRTIPILGKWREYDQIEMDQSDNFKLKFPVNPNQLYYRDSGDLDNVGMIKVYVLYENKVSEDFYIPVINPVLHLHTHESYGTIIINVFSGNRKIAIYPGVNTKVSAIPEGCWLLHCGNLQYNELLNTDLVLYQNIYTLLNFHKIYFGNEYIPERLIFKLTETDFDNVFNKGFV